MSSSLTNFRYSILLESEPPPNCSGRSLVNFSDFEFNVLPINDAKIYIVNQTTIAALLAETPANWPYPFALI